MIQRLGPTLTSFIWNDETMKLLNGTSLETFRPKFAPAQPTAQDTALPCRHGQSIKMWPVWTTRKMLDPESGGASTFVGNRTLGNMLRHRR